MSERFPDVLWYCDRCGAFLNKQAGFDDHHYIWRCTECGHKNSISSANIYDTEEDYQNRTHIPQMNHVFRVTKIGWAKEQKIVWFNADCYTKETAEAEFKPYKGITQQGYPYTGYEFNGEKYHDVTYLGLYEADSMPQNDKEYFESLQNKNKSK